MLYCWLVVWACFSYSPLPRIFPPGSPLPCTVPVFTSAITQQQSSRTTTKCNSVPPSTAHQHRPHLYNTPYLTKSTPHRYISWIALPWRWRLWSTYLSDKSVTSQKSWTFRNGIPKAALFHNMKLSWNLVQTSRCRHPNIMLLTFLQSVITKWQTCNIVMQDRYWSYLTWCLKCCVVLYLQKMRSFFFCGGRSHANFSSWFDSSN